MTASYLHISVNDSKIMQKPCGEAARKEQEQANQQLK